jgi:hypothetical protein
MLTDLDHEEAGMRRQRAACAGPGKKRRARAALEPDEHAARVVRSGVVSLEDRRVPDDPYALDAHALGAGKETVRRGQRLCPQRDLRWVFAVAAAPSH